MSATRQELIELLEPVVEAMGFELSDLECRLGRGPGLLRLFIDQQAGISLDDCELVSRQVSALLDVENSIPGDYDLEVSSPGLDRKLVKEEHFDRFTGCVIRLKLRRLVAGRKRIRGRLLGRDGDGIVVETEAGNLTVPMVEIEVARLVPDI